MLERFVVKFGRWQESEEANGLHPGGPNQQFGYKRQSPFRMGPDISSLVSALDVRKGAVKRPRKTT